MNVFHLSFRGDRVVAAYHLDEGMALLVIHNAALHFTIPSENRSQFGLGSAVGG